MVATKDEIIIPMAKNEIWEHMVKVPETNLNARKMIRVTVIIKHVWKLKVNFKRRVKD